MHLIFSGLHQVVLMLTSDLDNEEDKDRAALDSLLAILIVQLNMQNKVCIVICLIERSRQG